MLKSSYIKKKFSLILAAVLAVGIARPAAVTSVEAADKVTIEYQQCDEKVIPDKYNTGCKGELTPMNTELENTVQKLVSITGRQNGEDVKLWLKKGESSYSFRFMTYNTDVGGQVVFENIDFLGNKLETLDEALTDRDITLVFNNCKFGWVKKYIDDSKVRFVFNNCTLAKFDGSNAEFNRCSFGGTPQDPMVPLRNVTVRDSYYYDIVHPVDKSWHVDAVQIWGESGVDVEDLHFENCRFEVPAIKLENTPATVNSCIMFQLEKANAKNVTFEDIVLNGGGTYSIYAAHKADKGDWKSEDILFKNIKIGICKEMNGITPAVDENIVFENVSGTDMLYVASVFKENDSTSFSVTNDTPVARRLRIITDSGKDYYFSIKAGPTDATLKAKQFKSFDDIPADVLCEIPEDAKYAVCFDVTNENNIRQIRFVNYTDKPVTLDKSVFGTEEAQNSDIIVDEDFEGRKCTLHYTITKDYTLTVSGSGAMQHYYQKVTDPVTGETLKDPLTGKDIVTLPPWYDYKDYIKKIVIEDGITLIGVGAFRNSFGLEELVLEGEVHDLSGSAFRSCSMLSYISVAKKPVVVGTDTFAGVILYDKIYNAVVNGISIERPIPGDADGDGDVNVADVLFIQQYLAGWDVEINKTAADVTGDKKVNIADALLIQQRLAGWDVEFA